jgi:hypothetical protein
MADGGQYEAFFYFFADQSFNFVTTMPLAFGTRQAASPCHFKIE